MIKRCALVFTLTILCLGSNGCTIFSESDKLIVVEESQLNWLEIAYVPGMGQPPVQLSLMGSGHIRIRRGTSPLITNDFSQDVKNIKWNDIAVDQITIEPAQVRDLYQSLVNRGLLREPDKDFAASVSRGVPKARIVGMLNGDPVARVAIEPELIGFVRELLKLFDENKHATELAK